MKLAAQAALMRAAGFQACTAAYNSRIEQAERASVALRSIAGVGSGRMGLTPDSVKFSAPYRDARRAYDIAAAELRRFAGAYCKAFAAELKAERAERRAAGRL